MSEPSGRLLKAAVALCDAGHVPMNTIMELKRLAAEYERKAEELDAILEAWNVIIEECCE